MKMNKKHCICMFALYTHTPSMDYARTSLFAYNNKNIKNKRALVYIHTLRNSFFFFFLFKCIEDILSIFL